MNSPLGTKYLHEHSIIAKRYYSLDRIYEIKSLDADASAGRVAACREGTEQ